MLGTTVWLVLALGVISTVLFDTAASFARAAVHAQADHALEPALHDALADYQNQLQTAIAREPRYELAIAALPNPLTRAFPPDPSSSSSGPRFTLTYTIVPTTLAAPACTNGPSGAGPDTIAWLQCSAFVRESRMSLHITVRVLDASGAEQLAQREQFLTLRLFAEPPYSAVVGRTDGAAVDPVGSAVDPPPHEGDLGGDTVSGVPAASAGARPAFGTSIQVRYECHDGAGHCANAAPPDPDDARPNAGWTNGNRPAP